MITTNFLCFILTASMSITTAMPTTQSLKLIQVGRRKPDLTQPEYFDYHFRTHGAISAAVVEGYDRPEKYTQTHHPLSVFYPRPNASIPNANQPWTGRDDTTELYFRDEAHLVSNFASNYTRDVVGPDALNFADVETAISLVARESLAWRSDGTEGNDTADGQQGKGDKRRANGEGRDVALFFIASANGTFDGAGLEKDLTPLLVTQLQQEAGDVATELVVNVGFDLKSFDPVSYFGGLRLHALVYKVVMDGEGLGAVAKVRAAQKGFFAAAGGRIRLGDSFAVFGKEGTVSDLGGGVEFDAGRQPKVYC